MKFRKWLALSMVLTAVSASFALDGVKKATCDPPCTYKPDGSGGLGGTYSIEKLQAAFKPQGIENLAFDIEAPKGNLTYVEVQIVSEKGKILYRTSFRPDKASAKEAAASKLTLALDAETAKAAEPYFVAGNSIKIITKPSERVTVQLGLHQ